MDHFIIGVSGGTGSGKHDFCQKLATALFPNCSILSQDNFFRQRKDIPKDDSGLENFDHPDAIDFDAMRMAIMDLKMGIEIEAHQYDFNKNEQTAQMLAVHPNDFLIIEGALIFHDPEIFGTLDVTIYLDPPLKQRKEARFKKDVAKRGRDRGEVENYWNKVVTPMYQTFVLPQKERSNHLVASLEDEDKIINELVNKLTKQ